MDSSQPAVTFVAFTGRFSVWLFDLIFFTREEFCAVSLGFFVSGVLAFFRVIFAYALLGKEKSKRMADVFFTAYYASLPFVVGEILSFSMFNLQVCTAMAAVAFGFVSSVRFVEIREKEMPVMHFAPVVWVCCVSGSDLCVCDRCGCLLPP